MILFGFGQKRLFGAGSPINYDAYAKKYALLLSTSYKKTQLFIWFDFLAL